LDVGNAINSLILWTCFPMHMRGAEPTFTDLMHAILAVNPFVLLSIIAGMAAFRSWFTIYSVATILVLVIPAIVAFLYVPELAANQATPGLGLAERIAQYNHQLWQAVLAVLLFLTKPKKRTSRGRLSARAQMIDQLPRISRQGRHVAHTDRQLA
jgi:hypothetical protein